MDSSKVAVITGGGTGIGAAAAEELAGTGVKVVVVGRRRAPLDEVVAKITKQGGVAAAYPGDITDWPTMEKLAQETLDRYGRIDLVVPNAAVHDVSLLSDGDPMWWRTLIEINVIGLLNTVRAFIPHLYKQGWGHVIIVSSMSGRLYYVGEAVYEASKHAQVCIAECLRLEATPKNIKITIVEPGMVETPMLDNPFAEELKKTVPPLDAFDCARAIRYIFEQSPNCVINELSMRPLKQLL